MYFYNIQKTLLKQLIVKRVGSDNVEIKDDNIFKQIVNVTADNISYIKICELDQLRYLRHSYESSTTLSSCLNCLLKEEELDDEDKWYCPKCKEFVKATKQFFLWKLPDILIIVISFLKEK